MKVSYDKEVDAAFIRFSSRRPVSGIEIKEGVILHVADKDRIIALEILDASQRLPLKNLFKLEVSKAAGQTPKVAHPLFLILVHCRHIEIILVSVGRPREFQDRLDKSLRRPENPLPGQSCPLLTRSLSFDGFEVCRSLWRRLQGRRR